MTDRDGSRTALPSICILAGGLGTRLGQRAGGLPKPLVEVAGKPFLLHQLELLAEHGANQAVLCVGYLGERIEAELGNERCGIRLSYSYDSPELDGTLGAIRRAQHLLSDRFLVLYGDTYLRLDYRAAVRAWEGSNLPALMTVFKNEGRWEGSNAVYSKGKIVKYDKYNPTGEMVWIDYGLGGLTKDVIMGADPTEVDLAVLYSTLAGRRLLCGYRATRRFYDIGTSAALDETERFLLRAARQRGARRA